MKHMVLEPVWKIKCDDGLTWFTISSGSKSHRTPRAAEHRRPTYNVVTEMALM
jgi:hypothetical protein